MGGHKLCIILIHGFIVRRLCKANYIARQGSALRKGRYSQIIIHSNTDINQNNLSCSINIYRFRNVARCKRSRPIYIFSFKDGGVVRQAAEKKREGGEKMMRFKENKMYKCLKPNRSEIKNECQKL